MTSTGFVQPRRRRLQHHRQPRRRWLQNQRQPSLVGRKDELAHLEDALSMASMSQGNTVFVQGEAGIGKSKLIDEFKKVAGQHDFQILTGFATAETINPFHIFSDALDKVIDRPLFHEQERSSFAKIFAVNKAGLLVAEASPEEDEDLDSDIFASMLSAVQDFVRDSFDSSGEAKAGLGRLEYGDMTILIEHGEHIFVTAVFKSQEHPDMVKLLKETIVTIESQHSALLESWSGQMSDVAPIQADISKLAESRFLVRRELEGVKLENERIRISEQVTQTLAGLSSGQPLVLLLEDLHWADESSLFVLYYLARNIRDQKILLVGTIRPVKEAAVQQVISNMLDEGILTLMPLVALSSQDIRDLFDTLFPAHDFAPEFVENLVKKCEGNPFFLLELARSMVEDGSIAFEDGAWHLMNEDYTIPASVEDVVNRRLAGLETDAMAMSEFASCIGRIFQRIVALSFQSLTDTSQALDKLEDASILLPSNGTEEFSHAIIHDMIYEGMAERWKRAYHKSLGDYYGVAYKGKLNEVLYELARHYSKAGEAEKAFEYCFRAGEKAEGAFAAEQAIQYYGDALTFLSKLKSKAGAYAGEVEILERLGDIYSLTSDFEQAETHYGQALQATDEVRKKADFHRKIADVLIKAGDSQKGLEECDKGLVLLGDEDSVEKVRLQFVKGWSFSKTGEYDQAIQFFNAGFEASKKFRMEKEIGMAHHNLGTVHWYRADFDQALEHFEKALEIRQRINDVHGVAGTLMNTGTVWHFKGDLDKAFDFKMKAHDIYEKMGDQQGLATALNNIGIVFYDRGDLKECIKYYEESLRIRQKIGDRHGIATLMHNIGITKVEKGDVREALDYFNKGLEINIKTNSKHGMVYDHCSMAEALVDLGELDTAYENAVLARDIAEEIGAKGEGAWARRIIGMVYRETGEMDKAFEELEFARAFFEDSGEKEEIPKCYYELGLYWKARGDTDKARQNLEKALEMFREMELKLRVEAAEKALAGL